MAPFDCLEQFAEDFAVGVVGVRFVGLLSVKIAEVAFSVQRFDVFEQRAKLLISSLLRNRPAFSSAHTDFSHDSSSRVSGRLSFG